MPKPMSKSLSEKELYQLADILDEIDNDNAMSLEEVDGLFAAMHCSPEMVPPSDFLSDIWGDETGEEDAPFEDMDEINHFLNLLMRYMNDVGKRFQEELFFPRLAIDEETGSAQGNDWAKGFLKGVRITGSFGEMIESEEEGGCFIPIFILAHEHDENLELRPFKEDIEPEKKEELIGHLCGAINRIYRYLAPHRKAYARHASGKNPIKSNKKIGRNDPCSCGSGLKYKKCCLKLLH